MNTGVSRKIFLRRVSWHVPKKISQKIKKKCLETYHNFIASFNWKWRSVLDKVAATDRQLFPSYEKWRDCVRLTTKWFVCSIHLWFEVFLFNFRWIQSKNVVREFLPNICSPWAYSCGQSDNDYTHHTHWDFKNKRLAQYKVTIAKRLGIHQPLQKYETLQPGLIWSTCTIVDGLRRYKIVLCGNIRQPHGSGWVDQLP